MKDTVRAEIEALRKLKASALRVRYRELFGEESQSSNQAYLFRRVAWRLQALSEGDLSVRARERAAQLAVDADLRLRPREASRRRSKPGMQIRRNLAATRAFQPRASSSRAN